MGVLGVQAARYLHAYFVDYPTYAALTPGAFQFGYRDAIQYMESERGNYDLLMLSATDSNQPQVFAQFYRPIDPREWATRHDTGYLIIKPEEFTRSSAESARARRRCIRMTSISSARCR
jgi:hypothetical protein